MDKDTHHSGVYLLPNLFTTASLFAAFYAIVASMTGQFESAVVAIFIGTIADGLDGRIARLTNTQSEFGAQYDSLSDMVTFGVAPALLLYSALLKDLGKPGWLIAFIYTAAVALRLARFNTQLENADKRYFQGLPCPPAAAFLSSMIWLCCQHGLNHPIFTIIAAVVATGVAVLMVSNIRYYSFKEIDFKGKVPFLYVGVLVILFAMIAINPAVVIFAGTSVFVISGLVQAVHGWRKGSAS